MLNWELKLGKLIHGPQATRPVQPLGYKCYILRLAACKEDIGPCTCLLNLKHDLPSIDPRVRHSRQLGM